MIAEIRSKTGVLIDLPTSAGGNTNTSVLVKKFFSPEHREAICSIIHNQEDRENKLIRNYKFGGMCRVRQMSMELNTRDVFTRLFLTLIQILLFSADCLIVLNATACSCKTKQTKILNTITSEPTTIKTIIQVIGPLSLNQRVCDTMCVLEVFIMIKKVHVKGERQ